MKDVAAPFAVSTVLVLFGVVSAAMVRWRIAEYLDAQDHRRERRLQQNGGLSDDVVSAADPTRDASSVALYVGWGIDAAQAFVVALAPPLLASLELDSLDGKYLVLGYVAAGLLGLALFGWVLFKDPGEYDEMIKCRGLISPVVVAALAINAAAFSAVQGWAPA